MKDRFKSEADLASAVIGHLRATGWDIYQEVTTGWGVADIVAKQPNSRVCWVIECKMALGFGVLEQAIRQQHIANRVSIAVPGGHKGSNAAARCCESLGIGFLECSPGLGVSERVLARLNRALLGKWNRSSLADILRPEHQTHAEAGTNRGGYWTPFKETCRKVVGYVQLHPGATAKDVIDSIEHHWTGKSARYTMLNCIERGIIPGVRAKREGKSITIWPVTASELTVTPSQIARAG